MLTVIVYVVYVVYVYGSLWVAGGVRFAGGGMSGAHAYARRR